MIENLANYCYQLVDINNDLLDLEKYDKNHIFLMDNLDKYIASQPKINQQLKMLYEHIYKNVNYISINQIIDILNNNIDELLEKYKDFIHIVILSRDMTNKKSNFFFYLYFLKKYKIKSGEKIKYVFNSIYELLNYDNDIITLNHEYISDINPESKFLLIFCDDVSYSGSQLTDNFRNRDELKIIKRINFNKNIYIYLNIVGALTNALLLFEKISPTNYFNEVNYNIILPSKSLKINNDIINILINISEPNIENKYNYFNIPEKIKNNILDIIIKNDIYEIKPIKKDGNTIFTISRGELGNIYYKTFIYRIFMDKINLSLTYLDFKYPDFLSTLPTLCRFKIYDDKGWHLDYNELIKKDSSYINIFKKLYEPKVDYITISSDIVNIDIIKELNNDIKLNNPNTKYPWIIKYNKITVPDIKFLDKNKRYLQLINNFDLEFDENIENDDICNKYCIEPFYKLLKYKNIDGELYENNKTLNDSYLINKIKLLEESCSKLNNKYSKYKSKYLQTKS